jgi:hypothetical protein
MSKTTRRIVMVLGAVLLVSAFAVGSAQAQIWQQYSVPFSCGDAVEGDPVLAGSYATTVNLHNATGAEAMIKSSVSLSFPANPPDPGETSAVLDDTLPDQSAMQIDCEAIKNNYTFQGAPALDPYAQGFLVIETGAKLTVSATQTAQAGTSDLSVDVEEIRGRPMDPRQMYKMHKMDVCHRGRTLNVAAPAVSAHLGHGDTLGPCAPN